MNMNCHGDADLTSAIDVACATYITAIIGLMMGIGDDVSRTQMHAIAKMHLFTTKATIGLYCHCVIHAPQGLRALTDPELKCPRA